MSIDYSPKDLDVLIAQIDRAVASVRTDPHTTSGNIDTLVSIAEAVLEHARSVRLGYGHDSDFLRKLIGPVNVRSANVPAAASSHTCQHAAQPNPAAPCVAVPAVSTAYGKVIPLGKCVGQGGEGKVYKIPSMPGKVAKIYSPKWLTTNRDLEEKVALLSRKKNISRIGQTLVAAIPDELLYGPDGTFVGYIMPQVSSTVRLYEVQRDTRREKLFPDWDYRGLIAVSYNLAEIIDHLHKHDIVIGDMNAGNLLVHQDGTIAMIDCDSFDITDEKTGKHFPCLVGLQELLAPELQTVGSLCNGRFTKESDNFSLAIHIFRLLMGNSDPFGGRLMGTVSDSAAAFESFNAGILNGECVFVRDVPGKQRTNWAPPLDILPDEIQTLFRRVFGYTAATVSENIANRPTAEEWMLALQHFYEMPMIQCQDNPFHHYLPTQTKCPFCRI